VFTLHLVCFTEFTDGPEIRYTAGYSAIVVISLILVTNLTIVVYVGSRWIWLGMVKIRNRCCKRKDDEPAELPSRALDEPAKVTFRAIDASEAQTIVKKSKKERKVEAIREWQKTQI
jgi:hypothetical protein